MSDATDEPTQRRAILLDRFLASQDWPRSLETARAWLAEDPLDATAHRGAGTALIHLTRYPEAAPHLSRALERDPEHAGAHRLASVVCFHLKEAARAEEHAQRAIALQPEDAANWYHLAWMRYQQDQFTEAAQHARRALELAPNASHVVNLLALCEPGDRRDALEGYQRALELNPESSTVHNNLGVYYLNVARNHAAAADAFRQALRIDPQNETARSNLTAVFRKRSTLYQLLRMPANALRWSLALWRTRHWIGIVLLVIFWVVGARVTWPLLTLSLVLLYLPSKVYEALTVGDLRAWMSVPGARRGGFLGCHGWPFAARMTAFILFTAAYWWALYALMHTASFLWLARKVPGVELDRF